MFVAQQKELLSANRKHIMPKGSMHWRVVRTFLINLKHSSISCTKNFITYRGESLATFSLQGPNATTYSVYTKYYSTVNQQNEK